MNEHDAQRFVESLRVTEFTRVTEPLLRFVADLLEEPSVDPQKIAPAALEMLRRAEAYEGPLLHSLMRNALICDLEFERWARGRRRELLATGSEADRGMIDSLAAQAEATGYVWADDGWSEGNHGARQALVAPMFEPARENLEEIELLRREIERPLQLSAVGEVVRSQYERAPFPLWRRLPRRQPHPFADHLARWLAPVSAPRDLPAAPAVLIAGCGTGYDPLLAATRYQEATVTAIDLSASSLAYATRMARRERADNVRFLHGDLALIDRQARFDVIESHGVLHHLPDPEQGFATLVHALAPRGVVGISVYSSLGRRRFDEVRRKYGLTPDADDDSIRRMRDVLAVEERWLTELREFFVLPELRDLLYHPHELPFTIPQIQQLLDRHDVEFLGFERLTPQTLESFAREEADGALNDLARWDAFEQRHPETFQSMYRFWARRRC